MGTLACGQLEDINVIGFILALLEYSCRLLVITRESCLSAVTFFCGGAHSQEMRQPHCKCSTDNRATCRLEGTDGRR